MTSEPEELINAKGGKSKTRPERKRHTIDFIKNTGRDMRLLSYAGTLANLRDIIRDYDRLGDGVWDIFNASKDSVALPKENKPPRPLQSRPAHGPL